MSQHLDSGIRQIAFAGSAKLCANIVDARGGLVASEDSLSKVATLLVQICYESRHIGTCLRHIIFEDGCAR